MRTFKLFLVFITLFTMSLSLLFAEVRPSSMPIGYSVNIQAITKEKMLYAKSLGIRYIELSNIGSLLNKDLSLKYDQDYWKVKIDSLKTILDATGVKVWSIHMPFSQKIDLSQITESQRTAVVQTHIELIKVLSALQPQIILFHPSYYLGNNERELRISQLVKSVIELNTETRRHNMQMVVENMLGPQLTVGERERPLMRTIAECETVFSLFPDDVGLAVDMCHIMNSELLIERFGSRVKTLHVSDGDGLSEAHYLPCNKLGKNNWNLIFAALEKINYTGVFMYECKYTDEKELKDCYDFLEADYNKYKLNNKRI
ncbi:sugar phosphate isomerase/epimerase family protein [Sphingobacterium cavernae]|uniref:sugar phosphate isomerase/epimerase family protein n=1 Tax=Sphingobacterium cavernae TaxID=2592657 RepID=UPI00122FE052|nr:TIM barrel protein [Sphingobacterium cavernae]